MATKRTVPQEVSLPSGCRASRSKAEVLREAYRLHHQIEGRAEKARRAAVPKAKIGQRQLFDPKELAERKAALADLTGDNLKAMLKALEKLEAAGPFRNVATAPQPSVLNTLKSDFPNFNSVTETIQKHLLLSRLGTEQLLKIPAILVNGPPGVGKTAYCSRLAALLEVRFEQIDLSTGGANFSMTGLDSGYSSGHPGRIWESLQHESLSVLWQLDEIEKCTSDGRYGGNQYLLGLLEPSSAQRFIDNSTLLPLNASWIFYIATSNDKSAIDAPLRSRFQIFDIAPPKGSELHAVVRSIHHSIVQSELWAKHFEADLSEELIEILSGLSPREIRRHLIDAFANAALAQRTHLLPADVRPGKKDSTSEGRRIGFF